MIRLFRAAALSLVLAASLPVAAQSRGSAPVTEAELRVHIAELAADRYAGRKPGTEGETLTAHYLARQFAAAGFEAAVPGPMGWYAPVPLIEMVPVRSVLTARRPSGDAVELGEDFALRAPSGRAALRDAAAVFVGHGVDAAGQAPAGIAGRVVVMLASERAGSPVQGLRNRRDLLIRAGARAVLVISDNPAPFANFRRAYASGQMQLAEPLRAVEVDGLLSRDLGMALLNAGGIDSARMQAIAEGPAQAEPLTLRLTLEAETQVRAFDSYNVVARLPGRRPGSGVVMLTGHWDHLGECRPAGAPDRICNGAVDNASGMAVLIETARRLAAGPRLDRDVWIVATTAEEVGLLGAYHFVAQPPLSLASIHALLNIDTVAIAGRGAPVAIIGRQTTDLDDDVAAVAQQLGRVMVGEEAARATDAFIRRQDGWAFAQAGVPAIMAGGSFADPALLQTFLAGPYHAPGDELTDALPLGGAADDADLHVALVRRLASLATAPPRAR